MIMFSNLTTVVLFFCLNQCFAADNGCVTPPLECPNENITFWLYTRANSEDPHQLQVSDPNSITNAPWVKDAAIKIIIHGYTGDKDYSPNTEIRPAYIQCCDYNIISIDYNPIAREPCYTEAAKNTELVGKCTAQLVDDMVNKYGFKLSRFHVVGFSLGGQTAGFIANYVNSGIFERITGRLDPALPLFVTTNEKRKLDPSDAKFVDVLHTNALERGKLEPSGTVDFFANGGLTQPGCHTTANQSKSSCDHARAPAYYAESILTDVGFYATKCFSWIAYMVGWCEHTKSDEEVVYGEYIDKGLSGLYFFNTNAESPYAKGSIKDDSNS